jgi:hypothetical protein
VSGPSSRHAEIFEEACAGKQAGNMGSLRRTRKNKLVSLLTEDFCDSHGETGDDGNPERVLPPST